MDVRRGWSGGLSHYPIGRWYESSMVPMHKLTKFGEICTKFVHIWYEFCMNSLQFTLFPMGTS